MANTRIQSFAERAAVGLGWFSIALGLAELLAPRALGTAIGLPRRGTLLRLYGLREIGAGVALLVSDRRAPALWARVAGDALDLATLAPPLFRGAARERVGAAVAMGAVAGVTAADVACALTLSQARPTGGSRDYGDRSGFPRPAEEMRGIARTSGAADAPSRPPESASPTRRRGARGDGGQTHRH